MNADKNNSLLFANESAILRIASIAKIVAWVLLAFFLIIFVVNNLMPIFNGQMNWPTEPPQLILSIVDLLYPPVLGLFYFLVLQGVGQGLTLGLDIYYDFQPEEEEEEEVEEA